MAKGKNNAKKEDRLLWARAAVLTAGLIVAAFGVIILSSLLTPAVVGFVRVSRDFPAGPGQGTPDMAGQAGAFFVSLDLADYFLLRLAFSLVNVMLAMYLIYVHVKDYLLLRSGFTLGIVAFLFSFLLYALSTLPLQYRLFGPGPSMLSFVPMVFSAIGLLIFAKLSNQ